MKDQIWMTKNLDVTTFQNGDTILHAPSFESWVAAGKKGIPAWCYYNNDSILGKQLGKIYNWYAVNNKRELAPIGWKTPNFDEVNFFWILSVVIPIQLLDWPVRNGQLPEELIHMVFVPNLPAQDRSLIIYILYQILSKILWV